MACKGRRFLHLLSRGRTSRAQWASFTMQQSSEPALRLWFIRLRPQARPQFHLSTAAKFFSANHQFKGKIADGWAITGLTVIQTVSRTVLSITPVQSAGIIFQGNEWHYQSISSPLRLLTKQASGGFRRSPRAPALNPLFRHSFAESRRFNGRNSFQ